MGDSALPALESTGEGSRPALCQVLAPNPETHCYYSVSRNVYKGIEWLIESPGCKESSKEVLVVASEAGTTDTWQSSAKLWGAGSLLEFTLKHHLQCDAIQRGGLIRTHEVVGVEGGTL